MSDIKEELAKASYEYKEMESKKVKEPAKNYENLPPGDYVGEMSDAEARPGTEGKPAYAMFIVKGKTEKLPDPFTHVFSISIKPTVFWRFKKLFKPLLIAFNDFQELEEKLLETIGKKFSFSIESSEYNGKNYLNTTIKKLIKEEKEEKNDDFAINTFDDVESFKP